jgi:hypothetical protein
MQRHMRIKATLAGLAIAGGAAAAAVVAPASPALGFFSPPLLLEIHVNSPATLIAKGASADVSVQIECAGARTAFVDVSLTERVGSEIATGFGFTQVGCTNANQTVHVIVTAQSGKAFKKGTAVADGFISACTPNFSVCGSEQDQRTIDLVR